MGLAHRRKVVSLVVLFSLTSILVYFTRASRAVNKETPLAQALSSIKGWTPGKNVKLDSRIVQMLQLDDYVNRAYVNGNDTVLLYVGYNFSAQKLGKIHSPLVCFPSQGWTIIGKEERAITVEGNHIDLMSMILRRGQERDLVLYWFQAFDTTSRGTFLQKVYAFWAGFVHSREDNAFVRVWVPDNKNTLEEALTTGITFIQAFYPVFLEYVVSAEP
jgi:EpsI family protein